MTQIINFKSFLLILPIVLLINLLAFSGFFVVDAYAQQKGDFDVKVEEFVYLKNDRRDPLISLIDKKGLIKEDIPNQKEDMMDLIKFVKVDGILWDNKMPLAMVNNEIKKIGDIVNELTIKEITTESVVFEYFDLTHTITIIEKKDF